MEWKTPDENWLLESLVNLILEETITADERALFVTGKTALEKGQEDRSVANLLKRDLSVLAVQRKSTPAATAFLSELAQHYMGLGGRDVLINTINFNISGSQ
ncbi:MAG TPA: bacteriocin immunity protein [Lactobacillaceae bacterium]|jgi:hypothetical protein